MIRTTGWQRACYIRHLYVQYAGKNFVIHFTFLTDLLTHLRFITVYKRHAPDIFGSALVRPSSFLPGCSPSISEYISRACQMTHFLSVCTCSLGISTFCRCGCHVYLPGLEYSGADTRSNHRKLILHIFTSIDRIFVWLKKEQFW